ncbi:MAG: cation:proton antiporter [Pseudomonadota bacterium]|nr:cation:proton antiporter [Pseudomonadota bacterium]
MTLALAALFALGLFRILARTRIPGAASEAPALVIIAGICASFVYRGLGAPALPTDWIASTAEAGLAALVFASAAQIQVSRFARHCPASFRLTAGGAPLFLIICALCAFVLLPQLSAPSALLLGAILMLNGAAFDRRAVTGTPAPAPIKAAVRMESAAIIAFGAPVAILIAGYATAQGAGEAHLKPLLDASMGALGGFALGGLAGYLAARASISDVKRSPAQYACLAGLTSLLAAALLGLDAVIAAGAAGLVWGQETKAAPTTRLRLRRVIEQNVPPAAYFLFGCVLGPRLLDADLLSTIFAMAAVTVMRAGPRLAMLQSSRLPKESQVFLAWFGGAPGAASALFLISLLDDAMIVDHEALLTVAALAVLAGVFGARLTSRPLANAFLRQTALAKKRRMYAN